MNKAELFRRSVYILISVAGIGYEFFRADHVRWPLIIGYGFIIIATLFSFHIQGLKHDEETS